MQTTTFLRNPPEIRKAIRNLQDGKRLDLAVAFVGADWHEMLSDYEGKLRLICWLSSTNTNPDSVEALMSRPNTDVRQRDAMHCKVYLSPSVGAVVGSANLSKAALAADDNSGQDEAAVMITLPPIVAEIETWFEDLWNDHETRLIEKADLAAAKDSWVRAQQARLTTLRRRQASPLRVHPDPTTPPSAPKHQAVEQRGAAQRMTGEEYLRMVEDLSADVKRKGGVRRDIIDALYKGPKTKAELHNQHPGRGAEKHDKGDAVATGIEWLNKRFKRNEFPFEITHDGELYQFTRRTP
jgi:PLD-like domain